MNAILLAIGSEVFVESEDCFGFISNVCGERYVVEFYDGGSGLYFDDDLTIV